MEIAARYKKIDSSLRPPVQSDLSDLNAGPSHSPSSCSRHLWHCKHGIRPRTRRRHGKGARERDTKHTHSHTTITCIFVSAHYEWPLEPDLQPARPRNQHCAGLCARKRRPCRQHGCFTQSCTEMAFGMGSSRQRVSEFISTFGCRNTSAPQPCWRQAQALVAAAAAAA